MESNSENATKTDTRTVSVQLQENLWIKLLGQLRTGRGAASGARALYYKRNLSAGVFQYYW
jgi:hypothetical protein